MPTPSVIGLPRRGDALRRLRRARVLDPLEEPLGQSLRVERGKLQRPRRRAGAAGGGAAPRPGAGSAAAPDSDSGGACARWCATSSRSASASCCRKSGPRPRSCSSISIARPASVRRPLDRQRVGRPVTSPSSLPRGRDGGCPTSSIAPMPADQAVDPGDRPLAAAARASARRVEAALDSRDQPPRRPLACLLEQLDGSCRRWRRRTRCARRGRSRRRRSARRRAQSRCDARAAAGAAPRRRS